MNRLKYIHIPMLLLMALFGCKSCDDETVDKPILPNAAFETGELSYLNFFPADTIDMEPRDPSGMKRNAYVTFKANDSKMDTYEWTIGTDDRKFKSRSFTLYFESPGQISVKLKVTKNGKADSLTKPLVLQKVKRPKLAGVWEGSYTHKPDSIVRMYILNGYFMDIDGRVDTVQDWPAGNYGYDYIFNGAWSKTFYRRAFLFTNGGESYFNKGSRNGGEYGDTITFYWLGNNRMKVDIAFSDPNDVYKSIRREFYAKKIKWL